MKTYVIQQMIKPDIASIDVMQANNITQVLEFLTKKYGKTMGKIEFIYSEEYNEQYTNEKNTNNT